MFGGEGRGSTGACVGGATATSIRGGVGMVAAARRAFRLSDARLSRSHRSAGDSPRASRPRPGDSKAFCVEGSGTRSRAGEGRRRRPPPGADRKEARQRPADVVSFFVFAAFFRLSDV